MPIDVVNTYAQRAEYVRLLGVQTLRRPILLQACYGTNVIRFMIEQKTPGRNDVRVNVIAFCSLRTVVENDQNGHLGTGSGLSATGCSH